MQRYGRYKDFLSVSFEEKMGLLGGVSEDEHQKTGSQKTGSYLVLYLSA